MKIKMKNFLIYPFKMVVKEIKSNKQLIKDTEHLGPRINIYPFMSATYMFLFIISIMYIAIMYLVIGGIFIEPLALIGLIPTIITTWVFTLIYTKVYPKTKENYLKSIGFYNNDLNE